MAGGKQLGQVVASLGRSSPGGFTCSGNICTPLSEEYEGYVAGLQRALNVLASAQGITGQLTVDGVVGPNTTATVANFLNQSITPQAVARDARQLARRVAEAAGISPNFDPVPASQKPPPSSGGGGLPPGQEPEPLPPAPDAPSTSIHWGWWALGGAAVVGAGWLLWKAVGGEGLAGADDVGDEAPPPKLADFGYRDHDAIDV